MDCTIYVAKTKALIDCAVTLLFSFPVRCFRILCVITDQVVTGAIAFLALRI